MMRHEELVDFGADIIPFALKQGLKVQAYLHDGFWQDISTLSKFYEVSETASHQFSLISSSTWRWLQRHAETSAAKPEWLHWRVCGQPNASPFLREALGSAGAQPGNLAGRVNTPASPVLPLEGAGRKRLAIHRLPPPRQFHLLLCG